MSIKRFLLLSLFWMFSALPSLFLSISSQAAPAIMLPDSSFDLQITPYLAILEDKTNSLTIDDILTPKKQSEFTPNNRENLRFSISSSSYWLRFSIINPHAKKQSLVFSISNSRIDNIDLYEYKSGQINHHSSGSSAVNKAQGSHRQAYPFLIEVKEKAHQTYFVRLNSSNPINTLLKLQSNDQFLQSQQFDFTILGITLGLIFSIAIGLFFIWYFYQFKISLISSLYCFCIFIFIPAWLGQWSTWFPELQSWQKEIILFSLMIASILQILIVMRFKWHPDSVKRILAILQGILFLNMAATAASLFLSSGIMVILILCVIIISSSVMILILSFAKSEHEQAQYSLLISHTLTISGILVSLLTTHNFLNFDFITTWTGFLIPLAVICCTVFANLNIINQFREKRRLQFNSSDVILPDLLSKLSHEFRTPINGVMGMTELLSDTHLTHTQRDYLTIINLSGDDLLNLVSEMSDFAKLQSGRINLDCSAFDLTSCLSQCMARYQHEANRKQIELVLNIADDISPRLLGDKNRLQTVISNLIAQSLLHTESGELELRVFRVGSNHQGGIFFQIQLSGSLIEHDELRRLFRTMSGPREHYASLDLDQGLGLIIVKRLVALMGGSIEVETLTYQGCSITLFLPIQEELNEKVEQDSDLLNGQRILIVDDNSTFRSVIEKQVKRWGMRADSTYSGKEALALMRNKSNLGEAYDYIVIDHDMPIMDGIQLTERLIADTSIEPKPNRIMLTGLGIGSANQEAKDAGIQKVLNKPVSGRHLKEVLLDFHKPNPPQISE